MPIEHEQPHEIDLDRTDRLPILEGVTIEEDVADDSERLDHPPAAHPPPPPPASLPTLVESVRSVEERIARQSADYDALNRLYEKACDAQFAAGNRADTLAAELSAVQSALAVEQHRARELERTLAEGKAAAEAARLRTEESLREAERNHSEARTLREALVARDATVAQVLHSLGERDAQLSALQREHAQTVPALEARSRASEQLKSDLEAARANAEASSAELAKSRDAASALGARLARAESELAAGRRDLSAARAQATAYLELLRSREWRGGFNQNLFREREEDRDLARSGEGALRAECDRLGQAAAVLTVKLAEQEATISKLHAAGSAQAAELAKKNRDVEEHERMRVELHARLDRLEAERRQLQAEQEASSREVAAAREAAAGELLRASEAQAAADTSHAELSAQLDQLRAEAATHEEELTVLMAHLNEARRPTQSFHADIKRLNDEVALKSLTIDQLSEENRTLRTSLDRTRGALEERELLIRRLERSANNSANVLGRLQTSIERLGSSPSPPIAGEFLAELIKIEGDTRTPYALGRRTRIGRSPGCELQIDSQSVSRHHALLLKGMREIIIEDLNSTNGVLVNGRKVTRQVLSDGDLLTVGETQFECRLRPNERMPAPPPEPAASGPWAGEAPAAPPEEPGSGQPELGE
ncbi:MAG TPA: FHA domain-containing protein [Steroidobacteraceae bacterium]|jgi:chromosome segregation ATPase|nr:FHA domain-containing protein [Steroidobacteraceae bacterium]